MSINRIIQEYRMKAGLSQMDLVKLMYPDLTDRNKLESKKQYLSQIENNKRWVKTVNKEKLKQIINILNINISIEDL